jgi:hypothetical protein
MKTRANGFFDELAGFVHKALLAIGAASAEGSRRIACQKAVILKQCSPGREN